MFPRLLISTLFPYTTLFRSCVAHATSGNDTITFGVTGTIELGVTAFPPLNTSVAIQGPGASRLTVNGGGTSHCIIAVGSAATVQIAGLTIANGNAGAITNAGTLTVSECTLSGNSARGGGAIYNT